MSEAGFLSLDGKMLSSGQPLILPDNRSFRYGDGFFETMKMEHGKIRLQDFHFERLFASLALLHFQPPAYFTPAYLLEKIEALAKKNRHLASARIRLTIYRGEGGVYDAVNHFPHHLIQTWALDPGIGRLNENGFELGIFPDAKKSCDSFSHIKSNNYLSYAMAALWVKKQQLNEAVLLNPYGGVADATIANIFIVNNGSVKTPALSEGPVGGVMRRYLIRKMQTENIPVEETRLSSEDLYQASEIFLSNAIYGIRWVKSLDESRYGNQFSRMLHQKISADFA